MYMLSSLGRGPEDLSIGTFCHETGHMLARFCDLYDYGNRDDDGIPSAGMGSFCLMGAGNHLDYGRTPAPICAYLRHLAGWCDRIVDVRPGGTFQATHGDYGVLHRYATENENEYFLIENRSKLGLDAHLPSSGLAVYHCDVFGSNEWQEGAPIRHYQCALLQADGRLDLERNANRGDGGDLFGRTAGTALSHATSPASRRWDGQDSGLVVSAITPPGESVAFTIGATAVATDALKGSATMLPVEIPDDDERGISSAIALEHPGIVRRLVTRISIRHDYIGDLRVELLSPRGRRAILHARLGGSDDDLRCTYDSATPGSPLEGLAGEAIAGSWILRIADLAARDAGRLERWEIEVYPA
jgi:subtilisin-like proprotein convertase family protein